MKRWFVKVVRVEVPALGHFDGAVKVVSIIFVVEIRTVRRDERKVQPEADEAKEGTDSDIA